MSSPANEEIIDVTGDEDENAAPSWWKEGRVPVLGDLKPEGKRVFASMESVKMAIRYLSVRHNFPFNVRYSNSSRYEVGCNLGKEDNINCTFHIKCRPQESLGGQAVVIKSNLVHSCGCIFSKKRCVRGLGAKFVSDQAEEFLADCPKASAKHVIGHLKRTIGAQVTYRTAQRGKRMRIDETNNNESLLFQFVDPYFRKIEQKMPGSIAVMQRDEDNRLLRTFVMLKPMMDAFRFGIPVISVDACHLRNQFKGCLMAITMIDGMKQTQLLAWGTCPVENLDHWNWFISLFKAHIPPEDIGYGGDPTRVITVFSDREKGIANALYTHFPTSFHVFCYFHIEKNVRTLAPGLKDETKRLIYEACKAQRKSVYHRLMEKLSLDAPRIHEYLMKIPAEKWATSYSPPPHRKWGINTSNSSESMNSWLNEERNLSHLHIHAALIAKVMERQNSRRRFHQAYTASVPGAVFPASTQKLLSDRMDRGSKMWVKAADFTKFLVNRRWEVDTNRENPMCSCNEFLHTGLPCEHMAAAVQSLEGNYESELEGRGILNLSGYVDRCYLQGRLCSFYRSVVEPCALDLDDLIADKCTLPMAERAQAGRPKMARYLGATDPNSTCTCSRCGQKGHNKASCEKRQRQEVARAMKAPWREDNDLDSEDEAIDPTKWYYNQRAIEKTAMHNSAATAVRNATTSAPITFEEAFGSMTEDEMERVRAASSITELEVDPGKQFHRVQLPHSLVRSVSSMVEEEEEVVVVVGGEEDLQEENMVEVEELAIYPSIPMLDVSFLHQATL